MTLKTWADEGVDYNDLNGNFALTLRNIGQNTIQTLQDRAITFTADGGIFAEAYIDATGRNNSVVSATATFDTDKYKTNSATAPFVIIEATSISSLSDFAINNCQIVPLETGKWQLSCTTGTDEVQRAQIYKTLFYGSNGTNPRASSTYITGITALKTNVTRDVGKRAYSQIIELAGHAGEDTTATGTFADTTNNTACSIWSYCLGTWNGLDNGTEMTANAQFPASTVINVAEAALANVTSDETGLDKTADELDNPATVAVRVWVHDSGDHDPSTNSKSIVYVLSYGSISWATTGTTPAVDTNIDFYTDNSIPVLTAATEDYTNSIVHSVPTGAMSSTLSTSFATFKAEDWEAGADVQYRLTGTAGAEDTGWLDTNEVVEFTAFTAEPDTCIVKLIPKTTSPSVGLPSINGIYLTGTKP